MSEQTHTSVGVHPAGREHRWSGELVHTHTHTQILLFCHAYTYYSILSSIDLKSDDVAYLCAKLEAKELRVFEELKWNITRETETEIEMAKENLVRCVLHAPKQHLNWHFSIE